MTNMNNEDDELLDNMSHKYIECFNKLRNLLNEKIRKKNEIITTDEISITKFRALKMQISYEENILKELIKTIGHMEYIAILTKEENFIYYHMCNVH